MAAGRSAPHLHLPLAEVERLAWLEDLLADLAAVARAPLADAHPERHPRDDARQGELPVGARPGRPNPDAPLPVQALPGPAGRADPHPRPRQELAVGVA